ncbi:MAG TPA: TonB-dependent receptor [Vicinamibacterales bacterium]|nr:TonB-dependent receptor [Vicinamibacterales bacterium]
MNPGTLRATAVVICALAASPAVHAQSPPADRQHVSDYTLEQLLNVEVATVFGASRYQQRVTDAPAAVSIVTHEEIERFGYRTLADLLRGVRGFYVTNDRNYSYLGVRGFSRPGDYNTRVLVLVDGHRMNETVFDSAYIGADFPVPLELVERVEIVRGPSSSLYGTNALFGIVNVITKSAASRRGVQMVAGAGTLGTRDGGVSFGHKTASGLEMLAGGSAFATEGMSEFPVAGAGIATAMDDEQSWKLFASGVRKEWSLRAMYASRAKRIPTGAFGIKLDDPRSQTEDNRGYVELTYDGAWRGTGLLWRASYDRYAYDGRYSYDDSPRQTAYLSTDRAWADWWTTELMLTRRIARRHFLTGGAEFRHNLRQDQKSGVADTGEVLFERDASSKVFAAYLQDEFTVLPRLTLTAGLRHDRNSDLGSTNVRVAAIFKPMENSAVKLLYGSAYRAPNPYELYYYANPVALTPERIRTAEVVWEHYMRNQMRVSVSGFVYRARDLISQASDPDGRDGFVFANVARADAPGLEFEAEGTWRGLHALGSYTYQDARANDDDVLSNSPRHLSRARVTGPLVSRWLFFGVEGLYTGDRLTVNHNVTPDAFLGNVTVSSREIGHARLSLSVGNIFDRTYADPGAEEHPGDTIAQPGRTMRAQLGWRF